MNLLNYYNQKKEAVKNLNTYKYALMFLVVINWFSVECQNNVLSLQYKNLKKDLTLVKKCYLSKSPACTANERLQANKAIGRVFAKSVLIIGAFGGAFIGGKYLLSKAIHKSVAASRIDDPDEKERMLERVQDLSEKIDPDAALRDFVNKKIEFKNQVYWDKKDKVFILRAMPNDYERHIAKLKDNKADVEAILTEVKKIYPQAERFAVTNGGTVSGPMSRQGYTIFELTAEGELKVTSVENTDE